MPILARSPQVRAARRNARRHVRIVARNIKLGAARKGLRSIRAVSHAAGVPMRRTALMWFGINFTVTEMTQYMLWLDLTVSDMFAGTGRAGAEVSA